MKPGTQIAYIPTHAEGQLGHPDVEYGFVTSQAHEGFHFCWYWAKNEVGKRLSTIDSSVLTPDWALVEIDTVSQELVDNTFYWLKSVSGTLNWIKNE